MHVFYENRNAFFESFVTDSMSFMPHLHRQVEILYVLDGSIEVIVDGNSTLLHKGELFISFPNTVHGYRTHESSKTFFVIFEHSAVSDYAHLLLQKKANSPFLTREELHSEAEYIMNTLYKNCSNEQNTKLLKGYLLILLCRVIEKLKLVDRENHTNSDAFHSALLYIGQHFQEPISQASTARACGISKYHLSRMFTSKIGYSFNKYVNSLRVDYAKHLLLTTDLSTTEVGYTSGFTSQCSYYRAFRESSLPSPQKFRQENSQK